MSLKAFHIVFVTVSTLLAIGVGVWAIRDFRTGGARGSLYVGIGCFVAVPALMVYGRWFLRKLKHVSYL